MGIRENKVETYLHQCVTALGGTTRKWVSPGRDGVPDRIALVPMTADQLIRHLLTLPPDQLVALVTLVEVKTIDGDLSPVQVREHQRLTDAGAQVRTVYGHTGVDELIKELKGAQTATAT